MSQQEPIRLSDGWVFRFQAGGLYVVEATEPPAIRPATRAEVLDALRRPNIDPIATLPLRTGRVEHLWTEDPRGRCRRCAYHCNAFQRFGDPAREWACVEIDDQEARAPTLLRRNTE